ncbi:sensor histidine kinase [Castellaniella sp. WN]
MPPSLIRTLPQFRIALKLTLIGTVMAAILVADTRTNYEVAAAVFYTVVILAVSRLLRRRWLIAFSAVCIGLTALSFALTPHGHFRMGLVNTGISIASIIITTYLILKMEAARTAAHDAQAQLMRIARVKSLEGLTTSIAHEINQPLAAIVASGNACQRWLAQEPPHLDKARQALERILGDAGRASSIIARVRSLTQGEPPDKSAFDFNQAVMEVIAQSQAEIDRNGIILETDLRADLPPAFADRVQIQQVVGNLVLNAIEAMLPVSTRTHVMRITSSIEGGTISLAIADSGVGFSAGVHGHLFEAFWTTKPEGIGVGLSISRAIIEANGGQIGAESMAAGGAVFRFTVPAAAQGTRA